MNCPESYIKNLYKTLWSTSDAPVEGVTPFAQQPEHTIWTFQAELREIQDALSPRGPESLAALEHALSIGRAWWEQCGLTGRPRFQAPPVLSARNCGRVQL